MNTSYVARPAIIYYEYDIMIDGDLLSIFFEIFLIFFRSNVLNREIISFGIR